jgi:hypothetical protein
MKNFKIIIVIILINAIKIIRLKIIKKSTILLNSLLFIVKKDFKLLILVLLWNYWEKRHQLFVNKFINLLIVIKLINHKYILARQIIKNKKINRK